MAVTKKFWGKKCTGKASSFYFLTSGFVSNDKSRNQTSLNPCTEPCILNVAMVKAIANIMGTLTTKRKNCKQLK